MSASRAGSRRSRARFQFTEQEAIMDSNNENQDKSQQGVPASGPGGDQTAHGSLAGTASADGDPAGTGATIGTAASGGGGEGQGASQAVAGAQQQSQQSQSPAERRQAAGTQTGVLRPPVDVIEDAQGITLVADMPGVSKENLNLRLESQSLTIEGALSLDVPQQMDSRYAEIRHQHYERTFALSRDLDGEKATAELAHGVLRIRIPKTAHATPRKIPVNMGSA
jgi:HSP20 family protein